MKASTSNVPSQQFLRFKPLITVNSSQIRESFEQMTQALHGASFSGVVRFTLIGDPQAQSFTISLHGGDTKLEDKAKKVDLEVIMQPETWLGIAEGKLAPLDAFTQGKMRVRGDYKLGQRIMKRLAADNGRMGFC